MIRVNKVQHLEVTAHLFKKRNLRKTRILRIDRALFPDEFIIQSMESLHSIKLFELNQKWNVLTHYVPPEVAFEELAQVGL